MSPHRGQRLSMPYHQEDLVAPSHLCCRVVLRSLCRQTTAYAVASSSLPSDMVGFVLDRAAAAPIGRHCRSISSRLSVAMKLSQATLSKASPRVPMLATSPDRRNNWPRARLVYWKRQCGPKGQCLSLGIWGAQDRRIAPAAPCTITFGLPTFGPFFRRAGRCGVALGAADYRSGERWQSLERAGKPSTERTLDPTVAGAAEVRGDYPAAVAAPAHSPHRSCVPRLVGPAARPRLPGSEQRV